MDKSTIKGLFSIAELSIWRQVAVASEGSLVPVGRHKGRGSLAPAMRLAARKLKDLEGGKPDVFFLGKTHR